MTLEYDRQVDALYIRIQQVEAARTEEVEEGINIDFDAVCSDDIAGWTIPSGSVPCQHVIRRL